jgi:hypothetical protein
METVMAHKLQAPSESPNEMWFPPEADGHFDVVEASKILEWREKLAVRFGIGTGGMTPIDEPVSAE